MARPKKTLTAAEKKAAHADLALAIKAHVGNMKNISVGLKSADTDLAAAKKIADAANKTANKDLSVAQKVHATARAKAVRLGEAAAKGTLKLAAQQDALNAVPLAVAVIPKLPKAPKAPKAEAETPKVVPIKATKPRVQKQAATA